MAALLQATRAGQPRPPAQASAQCHVAFLLAGGLVAAAAAVLYIVAVLTHPPVAMLRGFDLRVYRTGGLLARLAPSQLYAWQLNPGIRFTYTPFAALAFEPLSLVDLPTLMDLMMPLNVVALAATVSIACREMGLRGRPRLAVTLLVAGIALWSQPMQRALVLGQVEPLLMGLVVWDLCQPENRWGKGLGTGIAAGVKLVPLIFIPYLLITRRVRQAAVAAGAFAATVLLGFLALPRASTRWWVQGYFLQAGRTGFVGDRLNQSLRGAITRLAGSVAGGAPWWLAAAVPVGILGMTTAGLLYRRGRGFESLMMCALSALLISPISWDHHWVWIAPGIAMLLAAAVTADRRAVRVVCAAGAVLLAGVFAAWPTFWARRPRLLHGGLLRLAPLTQFGHGDRASYVEYHWRGLQLLSGNLYVVVGCAVFLLVCVATVGAGSWHRRRLNTATGARRLRWPAPWRPIPQRPAR